MEKLLSKQMWQGIGAVFAAIGLVISVVQLAKPEQAAKQSTPEPTQQPTPEPTQQQTPRPRGNISVGGDGSSNCVNVGNGNNCTISAAPVIEDQDSLGIGTTWPVSLGCDGGTTVAAMQHDVAPERVRRDPLKDIRVLLTKQHAAAYGRANLSVSLTAKVGTVVQIDNLKPIFYRDKKQVQPKWVYDPMGGCGGSYARIFALNLDTHGWKDLGVVNNDGESVPATKNISAAQLGPRFHVSHDQPAVIVVQSHVCAGYHECGVELTYSTGGHTYKRILGTSSAPFRSAGAPIQETPVWTFMDGEDTTKLHRADTTTAPTFC
ncbi:hypothetical protein F1D05_13225 [Kribbella qitaiheensis]|uniref:Uncharacterized protein n=1 Tax=Kribbella qitaiheensis TaxID=1544730 RepID=A0A7G6WXI0_9ACTN|nr:hypothetical protein [Kribbella qitaiheensis]QNE18695.1 hypothetical protein F1D05_13225 [Kribbella qitaiheensis]